MWYMVFEWHPTSLVQVFISSYSYLHSRFLQIYKWYAVWNYKLCPTRLNGECQMSNWVIYAVLVTVGILILLLTTRGQPIWKFLVIFLLANIKVRSTFIDSTLLKYLLLAVNIFQPKITSLVRLCGWSWHW